VQCDNHVLVQQRESKDIWQGLHQFFLIEADKNVKASALKEMFAEQSGLDDMITHQHWNTKQALTHQQICFQFFFGHVAHKKEVSGFSWVKLPALQKLAFPRTLQEALGKTVFAQ
jgi:adenine-specific DNA glycosylase